MRLERIFWRRFHLRSTEFTPSITAAAAMILTSQTTPQLTRRLTRTARFTATSAQLSMKYSTTTLSAVGVLSRFTRSFATATRRAATVFLSGAALRLQTAGLARLRFCGTTTATIFRLYTTRLSATTRSHTRERRFGAVRSETTL